MQLFLSPERPKREGVALITAPWARLTFCTLPDLRTVFDSVQVVGRVGGRTLEQTRGSEGVFTELIE
jgi:hypothetical protein